MKHILESKKLEFIFKAAAFSLLCFVSLLAAGCNLDQKGMVMIIDKTYRASVVATEKDGLTVADGILWRDGKLYVSDEGGDAVRVWAGKNQSKTLSDSTLGIISPEDLVMDEKGNIFFTDDDAGGLWQTDAQGKSFLVAGKDKGLISTEAVALAPGGDLLVGDGERHEIFRVTRKGDVSVFLPAEAGIKKPESMVYDEKGNLYIADNQDDVLYLLTPDMKLHRPIANRQDFSPETILYSQGALYITDSHNGKLYRYSPNDGLQTIAVFGGVMRAVNGVTTDNQGNVYLSIQTDLKKKIGYVLRLEKEKS